MFSKIFSSKKSFYKFSRDFLFIENLQDSQNFLYMGNFLLMGNFLKIAFLLEIFRKISFL